MEPLTRDLAVPGATGAALAACLHLPCGPVRGYAVVVPGFVRTRESEGVRRVAHRLAKAGIGALRFDFTGFGESAGDLAETCFSTAVGDILAAARWLSDEYGAPALLVGHGFGGTASLLAAPRLVGLRALVTLNAPADPAHLIAALRARGGHVTPSGEAVIVVGDARHRFPPSFLSDLEGHDLTAVLSQLSLAVLFLHSPNDDLVGIEHARRLYEAAKHPKSFLALDGADHILSDARHAEYAAQMVSLWACHQLPD